MFAHNGAVSVALIGGKDFYMGAVEFDLHNSC